MVFRDARSRPVRHGMPQPMSGAILKIDYAAELATFADQLAKQLPLSVRQIAGIIRAHCYGSVFLDVIHQGWSRSLFYPITQFEDAF